MCLLRNKKNIFELSSIPPLIWSFDIYSVRLPVLRVNVLILTTLDLGVCLEPCVLC